MEGSRYNSGQALRAWPPRITLTLDEMRNSIIVSVLFACSAFSGSPDIPTLKEMWDTADFVISTESANLEDHVFQGDLPTHPKLQYRRVSIHFSKGEDIKGKRMPTKRESRILEEGVVVTALVAEEKEGTEDVEVFDVFGPPPFISPPPRDKTVSFLVFVRRDVHGDLEPVHPSYFMYYTILP